MQEPAISSTAIQYTRSIDSVLTTNTSDPIRVFLGMMRMNPGVEPVDRGLQAVETGSYLHRLFPVATLSCCVASHQDLDLDRSRLVYRCFLKNLTAASKAPSLPALTFGLLCRQAVSGSMPVKSHVYSPCLRGQRSRVRSRPSTSSRSPVRNP